ncbi:hypothetical protein [Thermoanaerobacterium thermosaccharolyticum]|uniref:hypothetical protein n=1 Tax=Thermoanaerobacterium thermosaccharolyticum TaxID=1517 RepID=UPI0020A397D6|nr:hypothetical protein [Thermoanaerobacterium thermosaccharolyticum]
MIYVALEEGEFDGLISNLDSVIKSIKDEKIQKFRWFQEKALDIKNKRLFDYAILHIDKSIIIIAALIDFIFNTINGEEKKSRYYFPLIVRKNILSDDYLTTYQESNYLAVIYDAVDDVEYIRCLDRILRDGKDVEFKSGGRLKPYMLLSHDIYSSERLNNKSSNSLTLLSKNEIVKTFRRMVHGMNPDLEMTYMLRKYGFLNVQDIRGYFLYVDRDNNIYTLSMFSQYIDNIADMWQYTQDYLRNFISKYDGSDCLNYIYKNCGDYISEVNDISAMIANMHIKLSSIAEENFGVISPKESDVNDLVNQIISNLNLLFKYIGSGEYSGEIEYMIKDILENKDFLFDSISNIKDLVPYFGKYLRCHGDLHLEQLLKTGDGYILIDFEGEPTKSISERSRHISPLKDVAGMIRSFNYAAYSQYFEYKESGKGDLDIEKIENLLSVWATVITKSFIENYVNIINSNKKDLIPDLDHLSAILALFKLDKAIFEAIYEVNNRPSWFKIPLKGIIECIEEFKKKSYLEVYYG